MRRSVKKKRILFAAVDVGFRIGHYSKFIHKELSEELEAESFSKYILPESHFKTEFTYVCPVDRKNPLKVYLYCAFFFIKALFRYDVFHFISGETILTRKLRRFELMTYKLFGKKVIMHFVGSDIRSEKYLVEKLSNLPEILDKSYKNILPVSEEFQEKLIHDSRKYAHTILVSTPDLLAIIPEATYLPVLLDFDNFDFEQENTHPEKTITILHSPSANYTKGSDLIYPVLENLQLKYGSAIELITPVKKKNADTNYASTRYDLLKSMSRSDIVIDQLLIGWYGLKAVEAMAMGNLVFCYIAEENRKFLAEGYPIVTVDANNLEEKLTLEIDRLLENNDRQNRKSNQLKFVHSVHDLESYKKQLTDLWLK